MDPINNEMSEAKEPAEICIPVAALALPGENGEVQPAEGDEVDVTGTAIVHRIAGGKAYLQIKTINGENATIEAENQAEGTLDDEEAEMRSDAAKSDSQPRIY